MNLRKTKTLYPRWLKKLENFLWVLHGLLSRYPCGIRIGFLIFSYHREQRVLVLPKFINFGLSVASWYFCFLSILVQF